MWADECQKTFLPAHKSARPSHSGTWEHSIPSVCSKSSNSSLQLFSRGRVRSQSSPSTLEMTVRSSSDFEMPLAIPPGVVSHDVPFSSLPLGREMVISSRGLAVSLVSQSVPPQGGGARRSNAPAISASCLALILSKSSSRCWINSGSSGSCRGISTMAREKRANRPRKSGFYRPRAPRSWGVLWRPSPWAASRAATAGVAPERPRPPWGHQLAQTTW